MYMTDCILINIIHVLYMSSNFLQQGHKIQSKINVIKINVGHWSNIINITLLHLLHDFQFKN